MNTKQKIMDLVAEYAAEKQVSAIGTFAEDEAATIGALHCLIGAALESMGEESADAVHKITSTMQAAAVNAAGLVGENLAKEAEYDFYSEQFDRPDWRDSLTLTAWHELGTAFSFSFDIAVEYEEAFNSALPDAPVQEEDDATTWNGYSKGFFGC